VTAGAPFLADPILIEAEAGDAPHPVADPDADVIAWAHNETSTGVMVAVERPEGSGEALVLIDATSGAGGLPVDIGQADAYYFAPQKAFGSDGGLWLALLSPAAIERIEAADGYDGRWQPAFCRLAVALENSRKEQTYNTPAWRRCPARRPDRVDARAGRPRVVRRAHRASSSHLYGWAGGRSSPRPSSPTRRSARWSSARSTSRRRSTPRRSRRRCAPTASSTSSPTASSAATSCAIGMFPAVEPADVEALTACIDWVWRTRTGRDRVKVLVKEKIADTGVELLREQLRRRARPRDGTGRAPAADRRVRRDPDPVGDQAHPET
jgi:phosphoserine aminotransferase